MTVQQRRELTLGSSTIRFRFEGHSDRGSVRRINEDSFIAAPPLFAVADGMGGHAFGDRASQAAIAALADVVAHHPGALAPQAVTDAIRQANDAVLALTANTAFAGSISGTTLTGVALVDVGQADRFYWMAFNVGDSRTYSWDGRHLTQLSVDHSAVQELLDLGQITAAEATVHPDRNVITRALGADAIVDADVWILPAQGRQTFLLCSDGLTKELDVAEIERVIVFHDSELARRGTTSQVTLSERLVNAAVAAGGSDNVTVVVVESESVLDSEETVDDDTVDRGGIHDTLEETRPRG
ncbi:MAG: hypothetical protein JWN36_1494 [Microbacteriaceae bacterium]|nr:hypothetical protein [Microbacteriaceae bacterium]